MVNSTSPSYAEALAKWQRSRNVLGGEDKVKQAGAIYLPKLQDQSPDEYEAYKMRALFFNATSRTVDAFVGMVFRKDPVEKIPESLAAFQTDANLHGQSFYDYQKFVFREVVSVGRCGTLVDWSEEESRPYCCNYLAEQIINWRLGRVQGKTVLTLLVLKESVDRREAETLQDSSQTATDTRKKAKSAKAGYDTDESKAADEFEEDQVDQIRVLKLDTTTINPEYIVEIYRKNQKGVFEIVQTQNPKRKGTPLDRIPFVFHGPNNLMPDIDRPPIDDIAIINLSHYRSSADLEHGRHFTGLPTAFASGFDANKTYRIGSGAAWVSTDPEASASFLEFTGQGLGALDKALEQKEHQMAVLGARMLESEKKAVETAEVAKMKQTGEQASLSQMVCTASESFELIYKWAAYWLGSADSKFEANDGIISCELNTDFMPLEINPQLVTSLVNAAQLGYLSKDSVVSAFKRGEIVGGNRTVEEELSLIEQTMPDFKGENKDLSKK